MSTETTTNAAPDTVSVLYARWLRSHANLVIDNAELGLADSEARAERFAKIYVEIERQMISTPAKVSYEIKHKLEVIARYADNHNDPLSSMLLYSAINDLDAIGHHLKPAPAEARS